ncbi:MAG: acyltransferase family protein [Paracoccaceae bacterium]
MRYRRDIDGLRAIAVLPVILFHAGFAIFPGGFVGVDVFFVISGYLITRLILADLDTGHFSLMHFYERRARRILPALFVMLAVSVALAWVTLMPRDMEAFARSLLGTALFASNIVFWKEAGYFDVASHLKPLLHTWSLAIEEQFYIFFPLFLMLVWRRARRFVVPVLIVTFVLSLGLAQWGAVHKPSSAFYLLPTRAWELLVGVFCAFYLHRNPQPWIGAGLCSALGLSMVVGAMIFFHDRMIWPGGYALVPTLGTALVILFSNPLTQTGRILQTGPLVGMGLISYSAYLWHQPVFVFANYRNLTALSPLAMTGLVGLTLCLAWLSWRYVERPFRRQTIARPVLFRLSLSGLAVCAAMGFVGVQQEGVPQMRIPADVAALAAYTYDDNPLRPRCFSGPDRPVALDAACVLGKAEAVRGVLLGDSHSDAIAGRLHEGLAEQGVGLKHMWLNGCPPVPGLRLLHVPSSALCQQFNEEVFERLATDSALEYVVIAARFTIYLEGETYDNGEGGIEEPGLFATGQPGRPPEAYPEAERRADVARLYQRSVQTLLDAGKTVIVVYPVPEQGWDVPMHMAKDLFYRDKVTDVSVSHAHYQSRNARTIAAFDGLGDHPKLHRVRPAAIFCDTFHAGRCAGSHKGVPLYYDDDHLSHTGAGYLTPYVLSHLPHAYLLAGENSR